METLFFLTFQYLFFSAFEGASATDASDMMRGSKDWNNNFQSSSTVKTVDELEKTMDKKILEALRKTEMSMVKSHRKTTYVTIAQDIHLGEKDKSVQIEKLKIWERVARLMGTYPWVSLRKMTVMWKAGVSNNVKWDVKMSFVDRRDKNDATRELFMMDFPISDNFVMIMAPGYTAHMKSHKALLPWCFEFDFPDGEFSSDTKFGTLTIRLEIDQYKQATQVPEIVPLVRFTQVHKSVEEPTIRWMSKGKWYTSSATKPEVEMLETIESSREDLYEKYAKFLAFLGFDPVKVSTALSWKRVTELIDGEDLKHFESNPVMVAKSHSVYFQKYREKINRALAPVVFVN